MKSKEIYTRILAPTSRFENIVIVRVPLIVLFHFLLDYCSVIIRISIFIRMLNMLLPIVKFL